MSEKIKLILSLSLSGSVLAGIIFAIKPLIRHKLSKSIQYYIWIIVLLRLIMPFSFETSIMNKVFYNSSNIEAVTVQENVKSTAKNVENVDILSSGEAATETGTAVNTVLLPEKTDLVNLIKENLLYIWLIGVFISFSRNIFGYIRFARYLKLGNRPAEPEDIILLDEILGGRKRVTLVRNKYAATPMLIGIIRPCIVIPDMDFTDRQLRNVLLHEITHLRRFDIGVKWLTVIAASLHWFNPLMYFIKREISNACELSCDEGVIKYLNDEEKQNYGDTLISMVAENKYPIGILSTTMCEEKKTLKERLISIMNHSKKSRLITILSIILITTVICASVVLGAGVGFGNRRPPDIYISSEFQKTKDAIRGGYSWRNGNQYILADSSHPSTFEYKSNNILSVIAREQLIVSTQKLKSDKKYSFTVESVEVYKDGKQLINEQAEPSFLNGDLYLEAPEDSGEYIYSIWLNFRNKGKVNYGFVVRVDMVTYDLEAIEEYKTPYIGNHVKVGNIIHLLPLPGKYFNQQYMSMRTSERPYRLNVYYEGVSETVPIGEEWPLKTDSSVYPVLQKNALVLFYMVDNLDEVVFAFRNTPSTGDLDTSKYDSTFTFSRESIEKIYGNQLFLSKDMDQLQDILNGKRTSINN